MSLSARTATLPEAKLEELKKTHQQKLLQVLLRAVKEVVERRATSLGDVVEGLVGLIIVFLELRRRKRERERKVGEKELF